MKVVSVSIPYPGPDTPFSGLFVQRRLEALARRAKVAVLSPRPWFPILRPGPSAADVDGGLRVERPRMFYLPGIGKGLDGYWVKRAILPGLRRLRQRGEVELIDAHFEYPEAVGAVLAARTLNLPVFITMRGLLPKYLRTWTRRNQILWALRNATGIISVADSLKRLAVQHGIAEDKIRVIANGVDPRVFYPDSFADPSERLERGQPLIVSVGHIQPVKGQHILVPAFAQVRRKRPDARLVLIGNSEYDPTYTRQIRGLIEQHGLQSHVSLAGKQSPNEVAGWLRSAHLFAMASYTEGCCNAVLEALACGVPVVTTDVGDNARHVRQGQAGFVVPPADPDALAVALEAALCRDWDRKAVAAQGSSRGWKQVAEETYQFFQERLRWQGRAPEDAGETPGPGSGAEVAPRL